MKTNKTRAMFTAKSCHKLIIFIPFNYDFISMGSCEPAHLKTRRIILLECWQAENFGLEVLEGLEHHGGFALLLVGNVVGWDHDDLHAG